METITVMKSNAIGRGTIHTISSNCSIHANYHKNCSYEKSNAKNPLNTNVVYNPFVVPFVNRVFGGNSYKVFIVKGYNCLISSLLSITLNFSWDLN